MAAVIKPGASEVKEEKEQYERVTTEPDGNCAFNAFALGLADGVLSGEITCPEPFYKKIAELLHLTTANAENFKKWLRTQTLVERQKKLQKVLREIAVDEIRDSYSTLKDSYHAKLKVAYDKPDKDDIFKHHESFKKKMEELREEQSKEESILCGDRSTVTEELCRKYQKELHELGEQYHQKLITWFEETGKKSFFETLKQSARNPGDQERWGSEEELAALARYFRINIAWKKAGAISYIGIGSGMVVGLLEEDRKQLVDLGIGERVGTDSFRILVRDKAAFSPLDAEFKRQLEQYIIKQSQVKFSLTLSDREIEREAEEQLKKDGLLVNDRLLLYKNIPKLLQENWKEMAEFIQAERGKKSRKLPDNITFTQRRWLEDRGIITKSGELEGKNGCPDSEVIFKKLADIPERLKKQLEEVFSPSKLMFTVEHSGGHWTCHRRILASQQKVEDEAFQQTVRFIDGLEDAIKKELVAIFSQIKNAPNPDKIRELIHTKLNTIWAKHQSVLTLTRLNQFENLWKYLADISIETVKKLADHFNKLPSSIPVPVKKIVPKEWHQEIFKNFLRLKFASPKYEVDCELSEITLEALKKHLKTKSIELLKEVNLGKKILLVRKFDDALTVFHLEFEGRGIQDTDEDEDEEKEEKENKANKKKKRYSLKIFSSSFVSDEIYDVRKLWKNIIIEIKKNQKKGSHLSLLLSEDFLKSDSMEGPTRIACHHVNLPTEKSYYLTAMLCKLLNVLKQEPTISYGDIDAVEKLHKKYLENARHAFIKDASVAKAQQGFCYQEHLIMLISYLATFNDGARPFSLISEAKVPEAWNDIILEWDNQVIFFQQKHRSLYSSSVKENYSTTHLLAENGDASLIKYYRAYQALIKKINNIEDPLNRYQEKLRNKQIKFIFFTNKGFPLASNDDFTFRKVSVDTMPLENLSGFKEVINQNYIYQIINCHAEKLNLSPDSQTELNDFFELFYLFGEQKNAEALFEYCKKTIKYPLGGFGEAFLADTFAHYIHRSFVAEDPEHAVLTQSVVQNFFENHETYHHNLVKYSCYDYPELEMQDLLKKHQKSLLELPCLRAISDNIKTHVIVKCDEPLVCLAIIQELFPAGERQVLTPFSVRSKDNYKFASKCKYVIVLGNDEKVQSIIKKIHDEHPRTRVIQIQNESIESPSHAMTVKVSGCDLAFLCEDYPNISSFKTERSSASCLTDWLSLAIKPVDSGLTTEQQAKYVPQTLSAEKTVLPYDKLQTLIDEWIKNNPDAIFDSWYKVGNYEKLECRLYINLSPDLPDIQLPKNPKFFFNKEFRELYYVSQETRGFQPVKYELPATATSEINFVALEKEIEEWMRVKERFQEKCPPVYKKIYFTLGEEYLGILPSEKWNLSTDKKSIFYYPFGRSKLCTVNWSDVYPSNRVTLIEAEAACGKTWYLKWLINEWAKNPITRIPLFIRIKDLEKVSNLEEPSVEMLRCAAFPLHVQRIAAQYPNRFHLLLDGFDELATEFFPKFESILLSLINKSYSITLTVRDYQTTKLQEKVASIIIQQSLNKFDEPKIRECLVKYLTGKFMTDDLTKEVDELYQILTKQEEVSEWLGIPLHVALIAEWYLSHREQLVPGTYPTITEVYRFILLNRIDRHSKRNRSDIYKRLYQIAADQLDLDTTESSIFPVKRYQLKQAIHFDLASTGLLRDPFSNSPELFHRTFAEFLIAKRWSRKVIRSAGSNQTINLKIVRQLYQTSNRLVRQFFVGLLEIHRTDMDIPYELTEGEENSFKEKWLADMNGKGLLDTIRAKKTVVWRQSNQDNDAIQSAVTADTDVVTEEREIKNKKELMEILKDRDSSLKKLVVSNASLSAIKNMIGDEEISISELSKIMEGKTVLISTRPRKTILKEFNCFNILGVFAAIGNKKEVFQHIWGIRPSFFSCFNPHMMQWWSKEDFEGLIMYIKTLKPERFDKNRSKDYLIKCSDLYNSINNEVIQDRLREWIQQVNMEWFLRDDYCLEDGQSILRTFQDIKAFDISAIKNAFDTFHKISKQYNWSKNRDSHVFACWSDGGYKDNDFAFPILGCIGPHLNIIHVFYMRLYVSYGGYSVSDDESIISNVIHHIETIDCEKDNLPTVFCSILLLLSLMEDWEKMEEHPTLTHALGEKITRSFERLLSAPDIALETKLFIRILLAYFMLYFDMRGYLTPVNEEGLSSLTVFSRDGFIQELRVVHDENMHQKITQYFRENGTIFNKKGIEQFEQLFTAWDTIKAQLVSMPVELVEEAVSVDTSEDVTPSSLVATDTVTVVPHKRKNPASPERVQAPIEPRSPVYLPGYSHTTASSPSRSPVPMEHSSREEHKSSPKKEVKKARVTHE